MEHKAGCPVTPWDINIVEVANDQREDNVLALACGTGIISHGHKQMDGHTRTHKQSDGRTNTEGHTSTDVHTRTHKLKYTRGHTNTDTNRWTDTHRRTQTDGRTDTQTTLGSSLKTIKTYFAHQDRRTSARFVQSEHTSLVSPLPRHLEDDPPGTATFTDTA